MLEEIASSPDGSAPRNGNSSTKYAELNQKNFVQDTSASDAANLFDEAAEKRFVEQCTA